MLAVITLRNRSDKEAFALLQQPFWLSAEMGVLDCTAPTDETGWTQWEAEDTRLRAAAAWWVYRQTCDLKFTASDSG